MQSRHVQWSPTIHILDVGVSPCLNEQLHAQSSMVREGSIVERSLAAVVEGVARHLVLEENVYHDVLTVVTCHVKGRAAKGVDSVRLMGEWGYV